MHIRKTETYSFIHLLAINLRTVYQHITGRMAQYNEIHTLYVTDLVKFLDLI